MELIGDIFCITISYLTINSLIFNWLRKLTRYDGNTQGDWTETQLVWLCFIFGPFLFFFIKPLRIHRKHKYLINRIRYYKWSQSPKGENWFNDDLFGDEIRRLERIYKLSKLEQKSRRNKLKKRLLLK